ncbi:class I SAM-dependent methyltransferase [uncultured Desulfobacter sp.]|uniref:class I SAM-dependent methyltransferase n=1 Tax=uncultured Desulfobacter sp. TaxID=240139 RepID=UPI0029F4A088|nr:class I SAM-dependent methyltransferase [uncultured Desulfobacter sp.]
MLDDIKGAQLKSCLQEKSRIERFIPSGRILDVGCGNGKFLRVLGDAWKKYGCDVAPAAVQFVRQNRLFNVRLGLLEELDYPKQFFDVVYFRASLHHTENPRKTLEVAHRLVKPSGIVAISMSNNAAGPCGRVFKGKTRSFDYGHTHFFTPATLRKLLRLCGLQEIYTYYPYFGTGYENFADLGKFVRQTFRLILGRDSDLVSPPFYGNYVSMFATPIHQ